MLVFLSCLYKALISVNNSLYRSLLISSDLPFKHLLLFFQVIVEKSTGSFSLLSLSDLLSF